MQAHYNYLIMQQFKKKPSFYAKLFHLVDKTNNATNEHVYMHMWAVLAY